MPGGLNGPALKQGLITAAPMFSAMAAGYASGRGPYAYMDQGAQLIQQQLKQKRDEEAAAAASRAFSGLVPGGMGGRNFGATGSYSGSNTAPTPLRADPGVYGGGRAGVSYGLPGADTGVAQGGLAFSPDTGMSGFTAYEARYGLPEGYLARTAQIESGGNPNAKNPNSSAGGLFQFIDSTAADYGLENRYDPVQATEAAARLAASNKAYLTNVLGREPTAAELYLAHQQGAGGAARLLSNPDAPAVSVVGADAVRLNGGDMNMTAGQFAQKWLGKFGGGVTMSAQNGPAAPPDPMQDPYVQQLMQVMAMPGLTPEQQAVVQLQLKSRVDLLSKPQPGAEEEAARAMRARDADLLGYQRGSPEWTQYVVTGEIASPATTPAGYRELELRAQAAGLVPGSPEYQQFMQTGGGGIGESKPAAFEALHLQALAAGFQEGSPEYKNFMATRGAGLAAESKAVGEARGNAIAGAPAEVQAADETLGFINEVRNHPGIDLGTGMTALGNAIPGTSGYDFQNRVNQLKSGAFLAAIDQLRGMGALSNAEGQTATAAIARLDTATSKEEFLAALADYERVVKAGRERAAKRIAPVGEGSAPPAGGSDLGLSEDDLKYLGQP